MYFGIACNRALAKSNIHVAKSIRLDRFYLLLLPCWLNHAALCAIVYPNALRVLLISEQRFSELEHTNVPHTQQNKAQQHVGTKKKTFAEINTESLLDTK